MFRKIARSLFLFLLVFFCHAQLTQAQKNLKELLSYSHPSNLCSSPATGKFAWTFNTKGVRNIFLSEDQGINFKALTEYTDDDGQEFSNLQFSPDGVWLVYMLGGEPGGSSRNIPINPTSSPEGKKFQLWSMRVGDKKAKVLVSDPSSNSPVISPDSRQIAFIKGGDVWTSPIDGTEKAGKLFSARGSLSDIQWSPDGKKLAFVSNRGTHSFIGIYSDHKTSIQWIHPSFNKDVSPRWSPDGNSIVFVRLPASGGGPPDSILGQSHNPWEIRVANIQQDKSELIWEAPQTLRGSVPSTDGSFNLHWAANNRIIFLSAQDNWSHLYSVPTTGGKPLLLTPGNFMTEYISLSPDRTKIIFSANTGPDKLDIDRRHIGVVSVDKQDMKIRTPGDGIEAFPVYLNEKDIAFVSSTMYRPALPAVLKEGQKEIQLVGASLLSPVFSNKNLVKPEQVIFKAPDGTPIHGQIFKKSGGTSKKPAIVCIHGGPKRQMLLGWNYSDYYAAHYAVNQWLADQGYVVLSVNYRLGIGYGNDFLLPPHAGRLGASEYQDILAAGKWLAAQSDVDAGRIGVYGGSYGGFLAAFALGRNSDLFVAGVDISGVHNRVPATPYDTRYEKAPDAALADTVAWISSPIAYVDTWTSPVLIIHPDDDRNVPFNQSVDLVNRLKKKGVYFEEMVIPDETHHYHMFKNLLNVYEKTVDFLNRKVKGRK